MAEKYVESIIIRQDNLPEVSTPSFSDGDCDATFEFEGTIKLTSIEKSVQNAAHNRHSYVFKILSIDKMQKED